MRKPNRPHAEKPAIALWLHVGGQWRRFTDSGR